MSKVFNFSTYPTFIQNMIDEGKIIYGGTGFFEADSPDLPTEVEHHFPDYTLYNKYKWKQERVQWFGVFVKPII
mgnify:CR=1 FL=1